MVITFLITEYCFVQINNDENKFGNQYLSDTESYSSLINKQDKEEQLQTITEEVVKPKKKRQRNKKKKDNNQIIEKKELIEDQPI